jgi:hypothetical protein
MVVSRDCTYPLLKEDLYIRAPELLHKGDVILKLVKSLYGLKQASREWFLALRDALITIEFRQSPQRQKQKVRQGGVY